YRCLYQRQLQFCLGRQAYAGPARIGIGFIKTYMTNRLVEVKRLHAGECHLPPFSLLLFPVQRGLPALLPHRVPAVGQPEFVTPVGILLDEFPVLAIGDQATAQRMILYQYGMVRRFIVEMKSVARMADMPNTPL